MFRDGKNAFYMRSDQRQVELRRLGNQLPVLGKANSLCNVGNISLQPGTSMILKRCRPLFRNYEGFYNFSKFCPQYLSFLNVFFPLILC